MYTIYKVRDTVRVPPNEFGKDLKETLKQLVQKEYEGILDEDLGLVLTITDAENIGEGKVVPGDGAAYHEADLSILTYKPEVHEIVEGEVSEITEFGAFVRTGPIDGLVHVSQIMDDYINYDPKVPNFVGKDSGVKLGVGDRVTARIVTVSLKGTLSASKIGLTMRQEGLGKEDWKKAKKEDKRKTEKAGKKDAEKEEKDVKEPEPVKEEKKEQVKEADEKVEIKDEKKDEVKDKE